MFNLPAGAAGALPDASIAFVAEAISASSGTVNGLSIGAADPKRTILIPVACRIDGGNLPSATLGGFAMTSRVVTLANTGINPTAIFSIPAGAGDDLDGVTSADLIVSAAVSVQHITGASFRVLNLSTEVPADTDTDTTLTAPMNINKFAGGIVLSATYRNASAAYVWAGLDNTQLVENVAQTLFNAMGNEDSDADETAAAISVTTSGSSQIGAVVASWRGLSNP